MRIDKLTIDRFRGATNPVEIEFGQRPISLIYGENGTGKSTIVDAIDFACNKNLGSILSMSLGNNSKKYAASLGHRIDGIQVSIYTGNSHYKASFVGDSIETTPAIPLKVSIIRRSEITKLITAQPNKRFEAIQEFVHLPIVEHNEAKLREAVNQKDKELSDATIRYEQAESNLKKMYESDGNVAIEFEVWAKKEANKDVSSLENGLQHMSLMVDKYNALLKSNERYEEARGEWRKKENAMIDAEQILQGLLDSVALQSEELLEVLNSANAYFQINQDVSICPVCQQSVFPDELRKSLTNRLTMMQDLSNAVRSKKEAEKLFNYANLSLEKCKREFEECASTFEEFICQNSIPQLQSFSQFLDNIKKETNEETETERLINLIQSERIKEEVDKIVTLIEIDRKSVHIHNAIGVSYKDYVTNKLISKETYELYTKLTEALRIHEQSRKKCIDNILNSLSGYIDSLYSLLHPDEDKGSISLSLKDSARASLELSVKFEGSDNVPPHAYYSESHIDTLGICVLLALAKRNNADVVVLDDVLTSIDIQHLNRFIELLSSLCTEFQQILVTTHYSRWARTYREGRGNLSNTQVIELGKWTIGNGIRTKDFKMDIDLLEAEIQKLDMDRQVVASKAGFILEILLNYLSLTYKTKVRRNDKNEYSLGELIDSISKGLKSKLKISKLNIDGNYEDIPLQPLLEGVTQHQIVRNCVGCHCSPVGDEISDEEVKGFGKIVLKLTRVMLCPKCLSLPQKQGEGNFWKCKCNKNGIQMYPHKDEN